MAEQDAERTERATGKRRHQAREDGQVARSAEVNSTFVLLVGVTSLMAALGWMGQQLSDVGTFFFSEVGRTPLESPSDGIRLLLTVGSKVVYALAPVLGATFVVGTMVAFLQVGWSFSTKAFAFRGSKLNPLEGLKKFVSKQMFFELGKNLLKVAVIGLVATLTIRSLLPQIVGVLDLPLQGALSTSAQFVWKLVLRLLGILAVLAAIDFWWQRHRYEEQLKMTKEEVKREHKDQEGDPKVKARIRSIMFEHARQRMMEAVKTADVIVTNPTHFSVGLKYEASEPAPRVIAKGQGHLAMRIREVAREHGVPVIEEAPLARALYRVVKVDDFVPTNLFEAVARVLAAVYRVNRRQAQAGAS
jgi:flagellar biosynthesis protein FlhB